MKIVIHNRQNSSAIRRPALQQLVRNLMTRARRLDPESEWSEVTLILTDDEGMRRLNETVFGRHAVTDVISQRYAPLPHEGGRAAGEVIVNLQRAQEEGRRQARTGRPWDAARELALYIAHGCDHLAGEDDADAVSRRRMRRRELRWVREAEAEGLLHGLLGPGCGLPMRGGRRRGDSRLE